MMSRDMLNRTNRHLQVIKQEFKELLMEGVVEVVNMAMKYQWDMNYEAATKQTDDHGTIQENVSKTKTPKSKKVNID